MQSRSYIVFVMVCTMYGLRGLMCNSVQEFALLVITSTASFILSFTVNFFFFFFLLSQHLSEIFWIGPSTSSNATKMA